MKKVIGLLQFVGMVLVFTLGIFALMSSGCATYRGTLNTPRGSGTSNSTNVAGVFVSTTENFNSVDARALCVAGYNQQRADGGGTVPNTFGTCTNDVTYGMPHPTMPMWGYGGYSAYNPFAPTAGAPGVRW